jgi:soluble lytic murein transglycosylase-like protein
MMHRFTSRSFTMPSALVAAGFLLSVNALAAGEFREKPQSAEPAKSAEQTKSVKRESVVETIKRMAPAHGVPTWFALRIAKVESNYKPHVRGLAGEYGVYQMKCATAREMGFRGKCSALLKPEINIEFGLKHLSEAMRRSKGNLKLAASKHNGGLARRKLVAQYVAKVF